MPPPSLGDAEFPRTVLPVMSTVSVPNPKVSLQMPPPNPSMPAGSIAVLPSMRLLLTVVWMFEPEMPSVKIEIPPPMPPA